MAPPQLAGPEYTSSGMKLKRSLPLLLIACWASTLVAQGTASESSARLAKSKIFALGPVGYAGTTSHNELDLRSVLSLPKPEAIAILENLDASNNPQAQAYALAGFRKLDRRRFLQLLPAALRSDITVETEQGCIVSGQTMRKLAEDLNSGEYDRYLDRDWQRE